MEAAKKICSHGQHHRQIPDDIIFTNILSRSPVKSLTRWKVVSKPWRDFMQDPTHKSKTISQWITIPPSRLNANTRKYEYDTNIHINSIDDNQLCMSSDMYVPPSFTIFMKQYNGRIIYCYHGSLELTVFNTITQESLNVFLPPILDGMAFKRVFEYAFDPLLKKYKVLTYPYFKRSIDVGDRDPIDHRYSILSDFKVFTLGGESSKWRSVENTGKLKSLSNYVTIVDGTLFWFDYKRPSKIISFSLATEKFGRIKLDNIASYFKRPLFEFEGSLFLVERDSSPRPESAAWLKLNLWMLEDIENSIWVLVAKNINVPLDGTRFQTHRKYRKVMTNAEFLVREKELLIAANDDEDQYMFSHSFLSRLCNRSKIVGQPFQHPSVEKKLSWTTWTRGW